MDTVCKLNQNSLSIISPVQEWTLVASAIDRLLFITTIIITIIMTLVILWNHPDYAENIEQFVDDHDDMKQWQKNYIPVGS